MTEPLPIPLQTARRLALQKQLLDGSVLDRGASTDKQAILQVMAHLRCIQIDPIRAVERTELLVLWSRIGSFHPGDLHELLFRDKVLFEDWAHCASIVHMEDYPLFLYGKRVFAEQVRQKRVRMQAWLTDNQALLQSMRTQLQQRGPLATSDFVVDVPHVPWQSSGWSSGRSIPRILDHLFACGEVMVADRQGNRKVWDLVTRFLPCTANRQELDAWTVSRIGLQYAIQALGVATPTQIRNHFMRRAYPHAQQVLSDLAREGMLQPVRILPANGAEALPGTWYVHQDDVPQLTALTQRDVAGRTVLLSPFDNLICDRARTRLLFDFDYTMEIYVPVRKRQYGYYVLPILTEDGFLGRMDTRMDRKTDSFQLQALYLESGRTDDLHKVPALAATIQDLARFLGARNIKLGRRMPVAWRQALASRL